MLTSVRCGVHIVPATRDCTCLILATLSCTPWGRFTVSYFRFISAFGNDSHSLPGHLSCSPFLYYSCFTILNRDLSSRNTRTQIHISKPATFSVTNEPEIGQCLHYVVSILEALSRARCVRSITKLRHNKSKIQR